MTIDQLKEKLRLLAVLNGDEEVSHMTADRSLLEYINDPEVTELFDDIEKWYS